MANNVIITDKPTVVKYGLTNFKNDSFQDSKPGIRILTEDVTIKIFNHDTKSVSIILKHYVCNKLILNKCSPFDERKNGYIQQYFEIGPKINNEPRKEFFSCQVITSYFNQIP